VLFSVLEVHGNIAQAAGLDALTGALNRRALMKHAERELAQSERLGRSLSIVGLDLDNFKKVNDTHGHGGGDVALCAFVDLVKEQLRTGDVIARMGGEEFVLVLPGMDASGAARLTENLRHSLEQMRVHYDGRMIVTTVSAGVTEMRPGDSLDAILKRADASLYRAKAEGRNCVVLGDQIVQHPKPVLVERLGRRLSPASATVGIMTPVDGQAPYKMKPRLFWEIVRAVRRKTPMPFLLPPSLVFPSMVVSWFPCTCSTKPMCPCSPEVRRRKTVPGTISEGCACASAAMMRRAEGMVAATFQ
jgi:diguanylate cyclase (GGDEF)-like protein